MLIYPYLPVYSGVRESGDHGLVNSWDRVPYITTVRTGQPSVIPATRVFRNNFFFSTYASQEGVDNDDGSSYYLTEGVGAWERMGFGGPAALPNPPPPCLPTPTRMCSSMAPTASSPTLVATTTNRQAIYMRS